MKVARPAAPLQKTLRFIDRQHVKNIRQRIKDAGQA